jgi:hypothetical protein
MHTALVSRILKDHTAWEETTADGDRKSAAAALLYAQPSIASAD